MSDDIHEIYAIKYGRHERKKAENYIGGDPHDVRRADRLFRLGDRRAVAAISWSTPASTQAMAKKRGRTDREADRRRAEGDRHRARQGRRTSSSRICTTTTAATTTRSRTRDFTCRTPRWPTRPAAACATSTCASRSRRRTWSRWCARCSPAASRSTTASSQIAPGITVHKIGGHSKGLQCVQREDQARRPWSSPPTPPTFIPTSTRAACFPITYNVGEVLDGYDTMKQLAPSPNHIVPGHDPLVLKYYPAAKPGLEGWVARLDVDPKTA